MGQYAVATSVDASRTVTEIERTVERYGASSFAYGRTPEKGVVTFDMHGRRLRFVVPLPDKRERAFGMTATGRMRTQKSAVDAWEQAARSRWRALLLVIKAQLEAVECGILTLDEAFMANIVLPGGQTVGELVTPDLDEAMRGGVLPSILPGLASAPHVLLLGPAREE